MTTSINNSSTSFFILANTEASKLKGLAFIVTLVFKSLRCVLVFKMMAKKLRVPDAPGGIRFCTACDKFRKVSEFPTGPRRFSCKMHMWATAGKKAKAKRMADTNKRIMFRLWGKAYDDCKRLNIAWRTLDDIDAQPKNRAHISITQREIEQLLGMATAMATDYSSTEVQGGPMEFAKGIAVVPVNPKEVLSISNAALVPNTTKRQLFRSWKQDGLEGYINHFHEAESNTKRVFRPSQEQIEWIQSPINSVIGSGCVIDQSSCKGFEVSEQ
jgi:hypothetical protein